MSNSDTISTEEFFKQVLEDLKAAKKFKASDKNRRKAGKRG